MMSVRHRSCLLRIVRSRAALQRTERRYFPPKAARRRCRSKAEHRRYRSKAERRRFQSMALLRWNRENPSP